MADNNDQAISTETTGTENQTVEGKTETVAGQAPTPNTIEKPISFTPEQQAKIEAIIQNRLARQKDTDAKAAEQKAAEAAKTAEEKANERIAALETKLAEQEAAAEQARVAAIVTKAAAGTHNPEAVLKLVDVDGLTDEAEITAAVEAVLEANPYLVKTPAPAKTPTPGVNTTDSVKLPTVEQLESASLEDFDLEQAVALLNAEAKR